MRPDLRGARTGEDLERRISRLEDIAAIKNLWFEYAYLADTSTDGSEVVKLHTQDAIWEGGGAADLGHYQGHTDIEAFITAFYASNPWRDHHMTNVVAEVADDGRTGWLRACLVDFTTMDSVVEGERYDAAILTADYQCDVAKVDGEWRISHVRMTTHQFSNWDQGWVKQPSRG